MGKMDIDVGQIAKQTASLSPKISNKSTHAYNHIKEYKDNLDYEIKSRYNINQLLYSLLKNISVLEDNYALLESAIGTVLNNYVQNEKHQIKDIKKMGAKKSKIKVKIDLGTTKSSISGISVDQAKNSISEFSVSGNNMENSFGKSNLLIKKFEEPTIAISSKNFESIMAEADGIKNSINANTTIKDSANKSVTNIGNKDPFITNYNKMAGTIINETASFITSCSAIEKFNDIIVKSDTASLENKSNNSDIEILLFDKIETLSMEEEEKLLDDKSELFNLENIKEQNIQTSEENLKNDVETLEIDNLSENVTTSEFDLDNKNVELDIKNLTNSVKNNEIKLSNDIDNFG